MSGLKRIVTSRLRGGSTQSAPAPPPTAAPEATTPARSIGAALSRRKTGRAPPAPPSAPPSLDVTSPATALPPTLSPSGSPHLADAGYVFCALPSSVPVSLAALLCHSKRVATIRKADAERHSLVTALANARSASVVAMVVSRYAPYALTLHDISQRLRATAAAPPADAVAWTSALAGGGEPLFRGALGLEACCVLVLLGVGKLRDVLEHDDGLGMAPDLVAQIRDLQAAAGVFAYLRDDLAPGVLADFHGPPPAEILPDAAAMLYDLALALAQALHVRRAAMNGMSSALLTKLSAAAAEKAEQAMVKGEAVESAGARLAQSVKTAARDLYTLARGWTFHYHGLGTPVEKDAGGKVAALKMANECLSKAEKSPVVGKVAGVDLVSLRKELEAATGENKIVYQHAIPKPDDIQLPPARSLATAAPYDAARIPAGEVLSQQ